MITVSELKFNFNALATENLYLAVDKILRLGIGREPPICGSKGRGQKKNTGFF